MYAPASGRLARQPLSAPRWTWAAIFRHRMYAEELPGFLLRCGAPGVGPLGEDAIFLGRYGSLSTSAWSYSWDLGRGTLKGSIFGSMSRRPGPRCTHIGTPLSPTIFPSSVKISVIMSSFRKACQRGVSSLTHGITCPCLVRHRHRLHQYWHHRCPHLRCHRAHRQSQRWGVHLYVARAQSGVGLLRTLLLTRALVSSAWKLEVFLTFPVACGRRLYTRVSAKSERFSKEDWVPSQSSWSCLLWR